MHERSLVQSLLTQVEQLRVEYDAVTVDVVTVEIGPLSGVEAELVRQAFDELSPAQFRPPPILRLDLVPLQIRCRSCGGESSVPGLSLRCPTCASARVHIIRGDEFRLIDVDLQVPVIAEGDLL